MLASGRQADSSSGSEILFFGWGLTSLLSVSACAGLTRSVDEGCSTTNSCPGGASLVELRGLLDAKPAFDRDNLLGVTSASALCALEGNSALLPAAGPERLLSRCGFWFKGAVRGAAWGSAWGAAWGSAKGAAWLPVDLTPSSRGGLTGAAAEVLGSAAAGARAGKGVVSELTEAKSFALARFEVGNLWAEVPAVISGLVLLCCGLCARGLGEVRPGEIAGDAARSSVDPCGMLSAALLTDEPMTPSVAGSAAFLLFLMVLVSATFCSSSPVPWTSGGGGAVGRAVKLGVAFSSLGFLAGVLTFDTLLSTKPPGGANRLTSGSESATGRDGRDRFDAVGGDGELG